MFDKKKIVIVWFNHDLRVRDNSALTHAVDNFDIIIPVYIHDQSEKFFRATGAASCWWLHHSLKSLEKSLATLGLSLSIFQGQTAAVLRHIVEKTKAEALVYNFSTDKHNPFCRSQISNLLHDLNCQETVFFDQFLYCPDSVHPQNSHYYQVFGAFYRACQLIGSPPAPIPAPNKKKASKTVSDGACSIDDLRLVPRNPDWAAPFSTMWTPGENTALIKADSFCEQGVFSYNRQRDFPCLDASSQLSPHLHFGEISIRTLWHKTNVQLPRCPTIEHEEEVQSYIRQLMWREFYGHLLYHNPHLQTEPMNKTFKKFEWKEIDGTLLKAWKTGNTGYPIIDAGLRQLWQTGWMHNRVRMIVSSFFVKHLRFDWHEGEAWFWDTLVDANLANNVGGWQWIAGCGADAAPYFRIFNPVLQSQKFDVQGTYIKQWVPELKKLSNKYIHAPWEAPRDVLEQALIDLGEDYPYPIVDSDKARKEALLAYEEMKHSKN